MKTSNLKENLNRLKERIPSIDLMAIDFHDRTKTDILAIDEQEKEELKAFQRIYRLFPHNSRKLKENSPGAENACYVLLGKGLESAHAIAEMTEQEFMEQHLELLNNDEHLAREIHHRATQVKAMTKHLVANVRDISSPHYRATLFANTDPLLIDYLESIPGYQDLFGTLDYLKCDPCASIFGPAAYFLDIMRITDRYITGPSKLIPEVFKLSERRPDLFTLKLTCQNTNSPIPYIQLVNEIIVEKLYKDLKTDVFGVVSLASYPFNLPYNLPLTRINTNLGKLNFPLISIARNMLMKDPTVYGYETIELARAALSLSPETINELITVNTTGQEAGRQYGFANIADHLPAEGKGTIDFKTKERKVTGVDAFFKTYLAEGIQIKAGDQARTITDIKSDTELEVDDDWTTDSEPLQKYIVFPIEDLTTVKTFLYRTGLSFDELKNLFTQYLSKTELSDGLAESFFINATGEGLPALSISQDYEGDVSDPVTRIVGVSLKRLDRLSRFIRLSRYTGIEFATLDWLMKVTGSVEITDKFLITLASIKQVAVDTAFSLQEVAAFLDLLKNRGDEYAGLSLFNSIFNSPGLLDGRNPCKTETPIPFDPARPLAWAIGQPASWAATKGKAVNADETSITLEANAPAEDILTGLMIMITEGKGKDQRRVIKSYDGSNKQAIIYDKWKEIPDTSSAYSIVMEPTLSGRLSAALKVKKADLDDLLGPYLASGLDIKSKPVLLTAEVLTFLWRLAIIPARFRLPVDNYLVMRRILSLVSAPSRNPTEGLKEIQTITAGLSQIKTTGLSVYELDYIINNIKSRFLRIAYNPDKIPAFLNALALNGKELLLSLAMLRQAGFENEESETLFKALQLAKFINKEGVILVNEPLFKAAALQAPVKADYFFKDGIVSSKESEVAFNEFHSRKPALLADRDNGTTCLDINYHRSSSFSYLFSGIENASAKRLYVRSRMDELLDKVAFILYAPMLPVKKSAFININAAITEKLSEAIFNALLHEAVIKSAADPEYGVLNVGFNDKTPLNYLFASPATGQSRLITAYDGEKQTSTIDKPWDTLPDAFSFYRIIQTVIEGTAKNGGKDFIQLQDDSSDKDGEYNGMQVMITAGTGSGEQRTITRYIAADHKAFVDSDWKTTPDQTSVYKIDKSIVQGNVSAWSNDSLTLAGDVSSSDNIYNGFTLSLIDNPYKQQNIGIVRNVLLALQTKVLSLQKLMSDTGDAQENLALQACGDFLDISPDSVLAFIPFAAIDKYRLSYLLPELLSPAGNIPPKNITSLLEGISRISLLADKLSLNDEIINALSGKPQQYGIANISAINFSDVCLLAKTNSFISRYGATAGMLISYLDISRELSGDDELIPALAALSGWAIAQINFISHYLTEAKIDWEGISTILGLLRLADVMDMITDLGSDANYLVDMAELLRLPKLGNPGEKVNSAAYSKYVTAADATLALLGARYPGPEFTTVDDQQKRSIEGFNRDALMGYLIWHLGQKEGTRHIRYPSDLFQYLLIDVEMSDCDTTSKIAQGINSVQLYMQRVRMNLEPGATADEIRETWWSWISSYRLWETNRKIFLYPENYIDPALRKSASPEFQSLINNLMQSNPTEAQVSEVFLKYFEEIEKLSNLVHVAGYKVKEEMREGSQVDESSFIVARTNTTPYTYYVRSFNKSHIPRGPEEDPKENTIWGPWQEIKVTIKASAVVPVFAFDRLFLFWSEVNPSKGSKVNQTSGTIKSETHSSWQATLKYTFRTASGEWVSPQEFQNSPPIRVMPNDYKSFQNDYVKKVFNHKQHYWSQPYAQNVGRGLPGTGTLSFSKSAITAKGNNTILQRQLQPGDQVWVAGQLNRVSHIDQVSQEITVDDKWLITADQSYFKIIPRDKKKNSFSPYYGPGKVSIQKDKDYVFGFDNTQFTLDFQVGDQIQVMDETRTVTAVGDNMQLIVDRPWGMNSAEKGDGTIYITTSTTITGTDTKFDQQIVDGDSITAIGQVRKVTFVAEYNQLLIDRPFDVSSSQSAEYAIFKNVDYRVIPLLNGAEKLVVFFGLNLDLKLSPLAEKLDPEDNPGDDPFISDKNQLNEGLKTALELVEIAKNNIGPSAAGLISGEKALVLSEDLQQMNARFLAQDYNMATANTSPPVRAFLDRQNNCLAVIPGDNMLVNAYWGNGTPETTANQPENNIGRPVLYNISRDNSFLYGFGNQVGWFLFNNTDQAFLVNLSDADTRAMSQGAIIRPYWRSSVDNDQSIDFGPYTFSDVGFNSMKFRVARLGTSVINTLNQRLFIGGMDLLLSLDSQYLPEPPFDNFYQIPQGSPPPTLDTKYLPKPTMDFEGSFGPYFWEIFYHAPLLVAEQLKLNRNFPSAKKWYEYIFNPTARKSDMDINPEDRFWRFRPFRTMNIPSLKEVLENNFEITIYNDDPFDPDAIAALRISAYAKAAVMKYIDNLIKWGDELFSADTRESITQATSLYVLAKDLLGPRPQQMGDCPAPDAKSFEEIKRDYHGDIPQFLIEAENSVFLSGGSAGARFSEAPVNDINAYFCVPENEEFTTYWDTIDDRLFKIRHCMNIQGVKRELALFAPSLDPRAVIQAFGSNGAGLSGASFMSLPIPEYKFSHLSVQAKNIISDVIQLGSALLSALEKKDAEALSQLRLTQESQILNLTTRIKEQQIEVITFQKQGLGASLNAAIKRKEFYTNLVSDGLLPEEILQVTMMIAAGAASVVSGVLQTASAIGYAVPQVGSPFAMTYGGQQIGASIQAAAGAADVFATIFRTTGDVSSFFANHIRRVQEWGLQQQLAEFDELQFAAQISAMDIQLQVAEQELQIHKKQIEQNDKLELFYKNKFTNEALYQWFAGRLAATYFQAYSVAYDLAAMTQRAFQYEHRSDKNFVSPGSWDNLRRGLLAGEALMLALNQMEGASLQRSGRNFEIRKTISLRYLDPFAFLSFIKTGEALFEFPESLFDQDFPGHYKRRIKTLAVTIPAVIGPYQNIHATLIQVANRIILKPEVDAVRFLLGEEVEVPAEVIEHNVRANQQIVLSVGQNDTGLFESNQDSPLYLPFEQTGAVSSWKLSMPPQNNPIDFSSISDVIIELNYTAANGGDSFRKQVAGLPALKNRNWSALIQAADQYATDWFAFLHDPVKDKKQSLTLGITHLDRPGIGEAEVGAIYFRLIVPENTRTTSQQSYITIIPGDGDPVSVSLSRENSFYCLLDRTIEIEDGKIDLAIQFNLEPGYTPDSLRTKDGERLSPDIIKNIELILFINAIA